MGIWPKVSGVHIELLVMKNNVLTSCHLNRNLKSLIGIFQLWSDFLDSREGLLYYFNIVAFYNMLWVLRFVWEVFELWRAAHIYIQSMLMYWASQSNLSFELLDWVRICFWYIYLDNRMINADRLVIVSDKFGLILFYGSQRYVKVSFSTFFFFLNWKQILVNVTMLL